MPVPEEIRKVKRPVNTIVSDSGKNSKYRYSVRERKGVEYIPGHNPKPKNGKVIGHIIDGKYVPLGSNDEPSDDVPLETVLKKPEMFSWGGVSFAKSVSEDILDDLLAVFSAGEASAILAFSTLFALHHENSVESFPHLYQNSYLSKYYFADVSKESLDSLCIKIGQATDKTRQFFSARIQRSSSKNFLVKRSHRIVPGNPDDLFSISMMAPDSLGKHDVILAFDANTLEPVCLKAFSDTQLGDNAYGFFLSEFHFPQEMIIFDKPRDESALQDVSTSWIHRVSFLRKRHPLVEKNHLFAWDGLLANGNVAFQKKQVDNNRFLYAFKDSFHFNPEEMPDIIEMIENRKRAKKKKNKNKKDKKTGKGIRKGAFVFETNFDLSPQDAYDLSKKCRMVDLVIKACLPCMQGNPYCAAGSEFISFVSSLITIRMFNKAKATGLLDTMTFSNLLNDLSLAWREQDAPGNPRVMDGAWRAGNEYVFKELQKLGLCQSDESSS